MEEETNGLIISVIVSLVWFTIVAICYSAIQQGPSVRVLSQCCGGGQQELVEGSQLEIASGLNTTQLSGRRTGNCTGK